MKSTKVADDTRVCRLFEVKHRMDLTLQQIPYLDAFLSVRPTSVNFNLNIQVERNQQKAKL
jgi:hypothetical protein